MFRPITEYFQYPSSLENANGWSKFIYPTFLAVIPTGLGYFGYKFIQKSLNKRNLRNLISSKLAQREYQIAVLQDRLQNTDETVERIRNEIVHLGFTELREQLQNGQLTAVQVLQAFQWRAMQVHEKTNCVCEFLLESTEWAKKLDEQYGGGNKKPTLFGIPVSVKECNLLVGHDCTAGFAQFIGKPAEQDSAMVTILKELGAVPFVTTNIPQSMMSVGSSNPVYGVTTNPFDDTRSPGGSSSGEGALIALRGSPLGIGSDIGGSVRVPAHWCGISALKPSFGRLAQGGRTGVVPGQTMIKGTGGPMGQDVDSLVWFMRTVCSNITYNLDPYVPPCPFNEALYADDGRPLTVGYYYNDNWLKASPACSKAVDVAKRILQANGHKLVPIKFPLGREEMADLMKTYTTAVVPDGGEYMASVCAKDMVDPFHTDLVSLISQPAWFRRLKSYFTSSKRSAVIHSAIASTPADTAKAFSCISAYRDRFIEYWRKYELDAVICPVAACPAPPTHIPSKLFVILWAGCALYNLLDFTAGVVPCAYVTKEDEEAMKKRNGDGEEEEDWVTELLRVHAKGTAGLPIGVQCVAMPFREEICLRLMKEIETSVKEGM